MMYSWLNPQIQRNPGYRGLNVPGLVPITPCCSRVHCSYWEFSICRTICMHHFIQSSQELSLFLLLKWEDWGIGRLSDLSQVPELLSGKKLEFKLTWTWFQTCVLTLFYLSLTHNCIQQSRSWQNSQYLPWKRNTKGNDFPKIRCIPFLMHYNFYEQRS